MAHHVFISYSSKDKPIADAVCAALESRGIQCWIAPRDVHPGEEYGESIVEAINDSGAMVLVFSANANNSPQIRREVERAVSKGIDILPFRIEDVTPAKSLEYFIGAVHWLDAFHGPLEPHLDSLCEAVKRRLAAGEQERTEAAAETSIQDQQRLSELAVDLNLTTTPASGGHAAPVPARRSFWKVAAVAGIVILAGALIFRHSLMPGGRGMNSGNNSETASADGSTGALPPNSSSGPSSLDNQLLEASSKGDADAMEMLLGKGADIEGKNNQGVTPLMEAVGASKTAAAKLLLSKGAAIEAKDNNGRTALVHAVLGQDPDVVKLLLDQGAYVETTGSIGETPLMYAAAGRNIEIVKLLLAKGANVHAKDNSGQTPLMYAISAGNTEAEALLKARGASRKAKDNVNSNSLNLNKWPSYPGRNSYVMFRRRMLDGPRRES
jgi:hypothetical protein